MAVLGVVVEGGAAQRDRQRQAAEQEEGGRAAPQAVLAREVLVRRGDAVDQQREHQAHAIARGHDPGPSPQAPRLQGDQREERPHRGRSVVQRDPAAEGRGEAARAVAAHQHGRAAPARPAAISRSVSESTQGSSRINEVGVAQHREGQAQAAEALGVEAPGAPVAHVLQARARDGVVGRRPGRGEAAHARAARTVSWTRSSGAKPVPWGP